MINTIVKIYENGSFANYSERTAIRDGTKDFTFRQVEVYSKRFATLIIQRADLTCEPIAVYLPKSASVIFADVGILYSGNVYVNLDVKSPSNRLRNILQNINPKFVVTDRSHASEVLAAGYDATSLFFIEDIETDVAFDNEYLLSRLNHLIDTDPICIINTSGSTGVPKGVVLHHRGTIDFMDWVFERFDFNPETKIASLAPFFFDIFTLELNVVLAKGATLFIVPEHLSPFPAKLAEFIKLNEISFLFWVPSVMVNISNLGLLETSPPRFLKTVFFAGEVFPTRSLNVWRRALPDTLFVNLYGPIEIHVDCTYFIVDRPFADHEPIPIGYPCLNSSILILSEQGEPVLKGEVGELCVRGSSVSHGYWNDKEKTAMAFVQNPLNNSYPEIIYKTGDLVKVGEHGEIYLIGRKDFQIKHMGYRIELPEIEHQVLGIEGIGNACVVYNQSKKEITLFYECVSDPIDSKEIRVALSEALPKYMLPTAFHRMDSLPLNQNGKIDRNGLTSSLMTSAQNEGES